MQTTRTATSTSIIMTDGINGDPLCIDIDTRIDFDTDETVMKLRLFKNGTKYGVITKLGSRMHAAEAALRTVNALEFFVQNYRDYATPEGGQYIHILNW